MNDNLKAAFKELKNLDVCDDAKETIKKIFCKAFGEELEKEEHYNIEKGNIYKGENSEGLSRIVGENEGKMYLFSVTDSCDCDCGEESIKEYLKKYHYKYVGNIRDLIKREEN